MLVTYVLNEHVKAAVTTQRARAGDSQGREAGQGPAGRPASGGWLCQDRRAAWVPREGFRSSGGVRGGLAVSEVHPQLWASGRAVGVAPRRGTLEGGGWPACLRGLGHWASSGRWAASFGPSSEMTPPTGKCPAAWGRCGFPGLSFPKPLQLCDPSWLGGWGPGALRSEPSARGEAPALLPSPLTGPGTPCWSRQDPSPLLPAQVERPSPAKAPEAEGPTGACSSGDFYETIKRTVPWGPRSRVGVLGSQHCSSWGQSGAAPSRHLEVWGWLTHLLPPHCRPSSLWFKSLHQAPIVCQVSALGICSGLLFWGRQIINTINKLNKSRVRWGSGRRQIKAGKWKGGGGGIAVHEVGGGETPPPPPPPQHLRKT